MFQSCLFAISEFKNVQFKNTTLVQSNFNGAQIQDCDFSDSDLMHSRFIGSSIRATLLVDCNLKGTYFLHSEQTDVDFKYSNVEDAFLSDERSELK